MNSINIIKANGEIVPFESQKLMHSLQKAGASPQLSKEITEVVSNDLYEEMTTKEIYKQAFTLLKKKSKPLAARYKLKKAIMELGDTGFPFEKFIAALLTAEGFRTKAGTIVQGKCVTHEVDVIAEKEELHYMCECKFHNRQGRHCDVKIPLYIHSRFKDVEAQWQKNPEHQIKFHQGWIFTNTRFTSDATQYAECSGLQLVSWDYPKGNGIRERIDKTGVHPITSLTTLTLKEKKELIRNELITCKDLCANSEILSKVGLDKKRQEKILNEAMALCKTKQ